MRRRITITALLIASALALVGAAPAQAGPRAAVTSLPPKHAAKLSAQSVAMAAPFPYAQTFALHSLPGAQRVVYLDFDGDTVSGTAWNTQFNGGAAFAAPAYDIDGNPAAFSTTELEIIQATWQRVAEDYAPFAVDVTTQDPGTAAIDRVGSTDFVFGTRALITNTDTIYSSCGCAGIGFIGVYGITSQHQQYQPALIFGKALGAYDKDLADAITHEVGHNLGLDHDGQNADDYYLGQANWAPLMGAGYYRPLTQWSKGEYAGATNAEDDFTVMQQNGAPLRSDDVGNTVAAASVFSATGTATGVIATDADVDVFSFASTGGAATFTAAPAAKGPNLDIALDILDAAGNVLVADDPASGATNYDTPTGLGASVSAPLTAGQTYYVRVQGVGAGDPVTNGYSGYGSVGQYTLAGPVTAPPATTPSVSVGDVFVNEGGAGATPKLNFTLALSAPATSTVTLTATTANGTALAGSDYTGRAGTVTIPAGASSATFAVTVLGDTTPEPHEALTVTLSNPVGATLLDGVATGTIINDDGIGIAINNVALSESNGGLYRAFTFTVTLSNAPTSPVSVRATTANYTATAPSDYTATSQVLSLAAGQKSKTFTVMVKGDNVKEANEYFVVNLTSPAGTDVRIMDAQGVATIYNDDV